MNRTQEQTYSPTEHAAISIAALVGMRRSADGRELSTFDASGDCSWLRNASGPSRLSINRMRSAGGVGAPSVRDSSRAIVLGSPVQAVHLTPYRANDLRGHVCDLPSDGYRFSDSGHRNASGVEATD